MVTPIPLEECRALLGADAEGLTDEQVLRIRDDFMRAAPGLLPTIARVYFEKVEREGPVVLEGLS